LYYDVLEKAVKSLRKVKGVLQVRPLSHFDRIKVLKLEREWSKSKIKGLGRPYNKGVLECLEKKYVVVMLTNENFEWPSGPYAIVESSGKIVAEINERGFKVFKERITSLKGKCRDYKVVFLPLSPPPTKLYKSFRGLTFASPSPRSHEYLLRLFNVKKKCTLGTMLVGFDDFIEPLK